MNKVGCKAAFNNGTWWSGPVDQFRSRPAPTLTFGVEFRREPNDRHEGGQLEMPLTPTGTMPNAMIDFSPESNWATGKLSVVNSSYGSKVANYALVITKVLRLSGKLFSMCGLARSTII